MLLKMWLSEKVEHLVTVLSSFKKCMHCFCMLGKNVLNIDMVKRAK